MAVNKKIPPLCKLIAGSSYRDLWKVQGLIPKTPFTTANSKLRTWTKNCANVVFMISSPVKLVYSVHLANVLQASKVSLRLFWIRAAKAMYVLVENAQDLARTWSALFVSVKWGIIEEICHVGRVFWWQKRRCTYSILTDCQAMVGET